MPWAYVHRIYAKGNVNFPYVEHKFFGNTQPEAMEKYQEHLKKDRLFRDCEFTKSLDGDKCVTTAHWQKL